MEWNNPLKTIEDFIMSTLKTALSTSATSIINTVPLITTTVETAAVVANSWLAELVNEDAATAMANVNNVKQLMLNGNTPTASK